MADEYARIRVGVIGAGRIGQIHAANLFHHPMATIAYVADAIDDAATALASKCAARAAPVDALFEDDLIDAVVIASSTDTHSEFVCRAAKAGKAIFCEKPLDLDAGTAAASRDKVNAAGVLMCLGFNRRHDPSFSRVRQEIDSGRLGNVEVVTITSRDPSPPPVEYIRRSGGLFRDMMIHDFDMARWLLGEEPVEIFAKGSVLADAEIGRAGDVDTAVAVLTTATGRICQITNSRRCSYGYDQRIEVFGSEGMARAGNHRKTQVEVASAAGFGRDPVLPFFLERYADAYRIQLDKFLRAVAGENIDLPGADDGVRALVLADAAQESVTNGRTVSV